DVHRRLLSDLLDAPNIAVDPRDCAIDNRVDAIVFRVLEDRYNAGDPLFLWSGSPRHVGPVHRHLGTILYDELDRERETEFARINCVAAGSRDCGHSIASSSGCGE